MIVINRNAGVFFNLTATAAIAYPAPSNVTDALANLALRSACFSPEAWFIVTLVITISIRLSLNPDEIRSDFNVLDHARNRRCRKRSLRWMKMTGDGGLALHARDIEAFVRCRV
ncbi:hypothetical protein [Bradyrhizobium sp.]|jgi:hypothetical protein|uniref:hypothetical protein n=1 Tax=Bradyrhizobium sp. TaxID=376 RepID=UPI003C27D218